MLEASKASATTPIPAPCASWLFFALLAAPFQPAHSAVEVALCLSVFTLLLPKGLAIALGLSVFLAL
jgi:hypothetical protein